MLTIVFEEVANGFARRQLTRIVPVRLIGPYRVSITGVGRV